VHVVASAAEARRVMGLLRGLVASDKARAGVREDVSRPYWSRRFFACDTEVRSAPRKLDILSVSARRIRADVLFVLESCVPVF
jgi:hypothetical protein